MPIASALSFLDALTYLIFNHSWCIVFLFTRCCYRSRRREMFSCSLSTNLGLWVEAYDKHVSKDCAKTQLLYSCD